MNLYEIVPQDAIPNSSIKEFGARNYNFFLPFPDNYLSPFKLVPQSVTPQTEDWD